MVDRTVLWNYQQAVLEGLTGTRSLLHIYGCGMVFIFGKQLLQKLRIGKGRDMNA